MASPAQILANQQNSLKSTGPLTPEGKSASSRNSTKHGLTTHRLLPGEDPAELEAIRRDYLDQFQPRNHDEENLFDELIWAVWNLRRFRRLHDDVLARLMEEENGRSLADAFLSDCRGAKVLDKLHRYQRDLQRIHDRAKDEILVILRAREEERAAKQLEEAAARRAASKAATPLSSSRPETCTNIGRIDETNPFAASAIPTVKPVNTHSPRQLP